MGSPPPRASEKAVTRALLAALLFSSTAHAAELKADVELRAGQVTEISATVGLEEQLKRPWSIAVGIDALHDRGTPYVELRYRNDPWSAYFAVDHRDGPRAGADYELFELGPAAFSIGLAVARRDEEVGTVPRYELRLAWPLTERLAVEVVHESNCKSICRNLPLLPRGPDNQPNDGQNWLVLRFSL
jgi:hypothetical protein